MTRAVSRVHVRWLVAGLLLALPLLACGPSFTPATPDGFIVLDEESSPYAYRATTADGVVIGIREIDHQPEGSLAFWTNAIHNQLRYKGGYALTSSGDVRSKDGVPGKKLVFGRDEHAKPHVFVVVVFVTDDKIYLVEAGGRKDRFDKQAAQVAFALDNFRTR